MGFVGFGAGSVPPSNLCCLGLGPRPFCGPIETMLNTTGVVAYVLMDVASTLSAENSLLEHVTLLWGQTLVPGTVDG